MSGWAETLVNFAFIAISIVSFILLSYILAKYVYRNIRELILNEKSNWTSQLAKCSIVSLLVILSYIVLFIFGYNLKNNIFDNNKYDYQNPDLKREIDKVKQHEPNTVEEREENRKNFDSLFEKRHQEVNDDFDSFVEKEQEKIERRSLNNQ